MSSTLEQFQAENFLENSTHLYRKKEDLENKGYFFTGDIDAPFKIDAVCSLIAIKNNQPALCAGVWMG